MSTFGHAVANIGVVCRQNCVLQFVRCQRCKLANHHKFSTATHRRVPSLQPQLQLGSNELSSFNTTNYYLPSLQVSQSYFNQVRWMSNKNFFQKFYDDMMEDFKKNKELKENLKKFREERKKLEESDALKKAREKFEKIEEETSRGSKVIKKTLEDVKEKVSETVEEVGKTEFGKKSLEFTEEISKTAGKAAETIAKTGQQLGESEPVKKVAQGVKSVATDIDELAFSRHTGYLKPEKPMKRSEYRSVVKEEKVIQIDEETTGITLHKDSKFYQSWQNFKDNNQYFNKMFELKMKYDESDNPAVRISRAATDLVGKFVGSVFTPSKLSETLTEIDKYDPNFSQEGFVKFCETVVIPNILEAMITGNLSVLKDWLHEGAYNQLAEVLKQALELRYHSESRVIDMSNVELAAGMLMEQGPVLVIQFTTQQIECWKDENQEIKIGNPDKILNVTYTWALCRDNEELDPMVAWKLLEYSAVTSETLF